MKSRKASPVAATPEVAAASAALVEEVAKNTPAPFRGFPSAQPQGDGPKLTPAMSRIVERTFLADDELEDADVRLTKALSIGERRGDYGTVMKALDEAEDHARLAMRLSLSAKLQRTRFELDAEVVAAAMRTEAVHALDEEKRTGGRTKQVTDADVVSKMASLFTDEWQSLADERRRLELTDRRLEHQVENWSSRCRSLQAIVNKLR
jgi:hypothetical protein